MKSLFILFLLSSTLFSIDSTCTKNLKNTTKFYNNGVHFFEKKQFSKAILLFEKSYNSASLALENCQNKENYDFNYSYNYMIESENQIQRIRESLIKNSF